MIARKKVLTLLLALSITFAVKAQQIYFKHFQTEDGLAHNSVFNMIQDRKGFMWIGTKGGLNRFDGNVIKGFTNKNYLAGTLGDSQINAICEDRNGLIWIGTNFGLFCYDPLQEVFKRNDQTKNLEINQIVCDKSNRIWFISRDIIYKFDQRDKLLKNTQLTATSMSFDHSDNLWFGNRNGQLKNLNQRTFKITSYQVLDSILSGGAKTLSKVLVTDSLVLIGTQKAGLKIFNANSKKLSSVITHTVNGTEIYVRDIIKVDKNNYWIATESGIYQYNFISRNILNIATEPADPYSLSDNSVYTLCKDNEGGIWAGTYFGGLNYYSKETNKFEKYYPFNSCNSISGKAIREISSINGKDIWIGTEDAGLNLMDTATGKFKHYMPDGQPGSMSYHNIHGLLAVKDKLYIGPFTHGLEVMDIPSRKITVRYPVITTRDRLSSDFVMSIFRTSTNKLLVGTTRAGLFEFDDKEFKRMDGIPVDSYIYSISEDHAGTLWVGTLARGAFYYNPNTGEKGNIRFYGKPGKTAEEDFTIRGILEDSKQCIWFCTDGGGLIRLDKNRKTHKKFDIKNGLPTNNIYRALEDSFGNIWISSLKGLICLNLNSEKIKVFTQANGLLTSQFNYNSAYKTPGGKMYFGSVKGLIAFEPSSLNKALKPPPLYFTSLQIENQDVIPNQKGSPLGESILSADTIVLHYGQNNFNIEFAAVSYSSPEAIRYKYKMEGLDKNWTYLANNRRAYFTDLSPGKYTFRVIAEGNTGDWTSEEKTLFITVVPPFWKSKLAYLFYAVLVLLSAYYAVKNYQKDMDNKNRRKLQLFELAKEKEVYQAKIEFFTTIAHEIQTPLTLIKGPIGWAVEKTKDLSVKKSLSTVEKNTDRLLELTSHLLDFRKAEINQFGLNFVKTNIYKLLEEQVDLFKNEASTKNLVLKITESKKQVTAFVDKEAFIKITANLLSNAIKYGEKEVSVKFLPVKTSDKYFRIQFRNDGHTIAAEEQALIFKPFSRAGNSKNKPGTGIGLSLAKSLSELHNGELKLLSSINGFTIFELILPLHQEFEFILGK